MKKIITAGLFTLATLALSHAEPAMPETPKDVAAAPKDAVTTESGLASKLLEKGKGETKPKATDLVTVHYSGWTTDGKLFDSSVKRGQPGVINWPSMPIVMIQSAREALRAFHFTPSGGGPA